MSSPEDEITPAVPDRQVVSSPQDEIAPAVPAQHRTTREGHSSPVRGDDTLELFRQYRRAPSVELRNLLVLRHGRLVHYIARRFASGVATGPEDLVQVGFVGLIRAIEGYDPNTGRAFVTFATPTIVGVIKHYLRDHTWALKAPRRLRELATSLRRLRPRLEQSLGRVPTITEMADAAGVTEERLLQAMEVDALYDSTSLDSAIPDGRGEEQPSLGEVIGQPDPAIALVEIREAIRRAVACLDEREQAIIHHRFFGEMAQSQVATELGISQMHVSRLERRALQRLRDLLT